MSKLPMFRHWRPTITWALMLMQVHLLLVAVLHHHASEAFPSGAATLCGQQRQAQPAADRGIPCPACQIVRHSAVRPAVSAPMPEPTAATPLPRAFASSHYRFLQPTIVYGRAPPLA